MKRFGRGRIGAVIGCLLGAFFSSGQNAAAQEDGLMGSTLAAARQTDLFTFFHFVPLREEAGSGGNRVTFFKPSGDAFKALVTLSVTTDKQDAIQELHLTVMRSFIDDPKKSIYAGDLVKSLLRNAAGNSPGDPVGSLATEIERRSISGASVTVLTAQPLPPIPATPSAAYQTYAGNPPDQTLVYPSGKTQVVLHNETVDGERVLSLVVSPLAPGR
jgi:hypothetical protein